MLKRKRKDKRFNLMFYVLLTIDIILLITIFFTYYSKPLQVQTFDVKFTVDKNSGFDLNSSALTFGKAAPGSSTTRKISIENNYDFPIEARVYVTGNLRDFISVDDYFVLESKEKISVPVTLYVKEDVPFGDYSGKIKFELRK